MDNFRSLKGRTALVTGGTSGIGFYTARAMATLGAEVTITGRDERRGQAAARQMQENAGHTGVRFIRSDASTVGGNQLLANQVLAETARLNILINNVGGLYNDRWETGDGYEATLAMNLVGPFALTEALMPALRGGAPARIINVTSAGYAMWKGDPFADLQANESYLGSQAYARTKFLNMVWTFALARRLEGSGIVANAVHPGMAWTTMLQSNEPRLFPAGVRLLWPILRLLQRRGSPEQAAQTSTYLASAPEAAQVNGQYFESSTRPKNPGPAVLDQVTQERAWELAASLVRNAPTAASRNAVETEITSRFPEKVA